MNEKVAKALDYVDAKYIAEAGERRRKKLNWKMVVAALLAVILLCHMPSIPLIVSARAVSIASQSRKTQRPNIHSERFDRWYDEHRARSAVAALAVDPLADFAARCSREVLSGMDDVNRLWSPINAYLALAMTAELTAGETQRELLEVLGKSELSDLRAMVCAVWETIYQNNGKEVSVLGNSLWLDDEVRYEQSVMDILSYHYYASVYQGDLGSESTNKAITNWLDNQTGGVLKNRTGTVRIDPDTEPMLAMASTIYFQSQWNDQFSAEKNCEGVFHTASGDTECTFMNKKEAQMSYYWAEDYGAVQLWLENGSCMWFILPDEDKSVDDVLCSGDYAAMIAGADTFPKENEKWMKVNLSVPKFDVSADVDLKEGLENMGLTRIFQRFGNDFSPSIDSEYPVYLGGIHQSSRVTIDEEGVLAASYILLEFGAGASAPPDEIIDFVLDRPFLFAITCEHIPLFIGAVNSVK